MEPIYNQSFTLEFPLFDSAGDLIVSASGISAQISKDSSAFTNTTNSVSTLSNGMYSLVLTATEMAATRISLIIDATTPTDTKPTVIVLYPLSSGTDVSALLNATIEGSYTLQQVFQLIAGIMAGKTSGGATTEVTFRNLSDTKDILTATVDSQGNRDSVTLDLS